MAGAGTIPGIRRIRNASQSFPALTSTTEESEITIETREAAGSVPWLTGLDCDLGEAKIGLARIDEERSGSDCVDRVYIYRIGWRELPKTALLVVSYAI